MSEKPEAKPILVWGLLIFLALIWGSSFILIKRGLDVFSAGQVGALRIFTAAIVLVPLSLPKLKTLTPRQWKWLFISGMIGSFGPAFLFAIAQTQLASGITGVLNALTPIFALVVGVLFFGGQLKKQDVLGITLGFAGTVLLIVAGSGGELGNFNYYAFFVIAATLCYGFNLNILKHQFSVLTPKIITSISLLLISPLATFYLFGYTDFLEVMSNKEGAYLSLTYISILGVVGTAFALIIFNRLVQLTSPVFTSFVTYLIPIVAIIWGIIDGEVLIFWHYIGIVLIIVGVAFSNRKKK
ncbi:DMT family transporter [Marivirga atlantica]|jgi:drug/metabolite transporter (DMT)-like permease|uniref:DMT family transporter n=1 Tax=Marivirga atlantica TaxID=1548457 RepID=A0A937A7E9_9BACT|nr:DMT family transporter [Marivirga atlantica]MBL0763736.1 DMT family transporter [Marivirga atlantica]